MVCANDAKNAPSAPQTLGGTTHCLPVEKPETICERLRSALDARAGKATTVEMEVADAG